jgi:3-hydroxybutyryl-CoA dehydrogenase
MNIKTIFVVGAGTMGNGSAQVAATSGYQVTLMDVAPEQLERAQKTIDKSTAKLLEKGKITIEQREAALSIPTAATLEGAAEADLVIEAATENPEIKLQIFRDLDEIAKPEAILASNTSSISLTKIGAATTAPNRLSGCTL